MEDIIRQVIESEYRAHKIIGEAEEARNHMAAGIENEIQKIKDAVFTSTQKKIDEIRNEKKSQAELQAKEIMEKAKDSVCLMQQKFESNRLVWAKSLLGIILGSND